MVTLVELTGASELACERLKAILLTLCGHWEVRDALAHLGIGRTRFQDLRRRTLAACVAALESRPLGRPRGEVREDGGRIASLKEENRDLEHALRLVRAELELARLGLLPAIRGRRDAVIGGGE